VLVGGIVAYANSVKERFLDVPASMLAAHGAVSEPVARQMASAARHRLGAEIGVAITGIAGPGGGTPEKPVGTVWIVVEVGDVARALRTLFVGDREEIRERAAQSALDMIRRALAED
jgi:nicotinamide-nucleotide amidase